MHRMQFLGVTPAEEKTYRHLLRHPGSSAEEVVAAPWQPDGDGAAVVRRLKELGAVVENGGALWPEKPELVAGRLTERLLTELHALTRGLSEVYPMVRSLRDEAACGRNGGAGAPPDGGTVERITDAAALRARVEELARGTRSELLAGGLCGERGLGAPWVTVPLCLDMLDRGVAVRLLVWRSALGSPAVVAHLRRLAGAGARVRVLPSSEGPMVVYDGGTVLVPVVSSDSGRGAFVAGEPGLVSMVVNHFERLWADAREFGGG
ncbi:TrmB family transcriptional regulator [Streptomyces termitum]|uniref:Uncharacterized protein n=1 Tax=Streptomyces termitum TaxID=67368 RepID=A0A918T5Q2_9ACTN|nr:helix-turn-helix transcriptional regulator [Streptomyces termitum]GHA98534.1 hypothetical protein GCM10010305_47550 [Streptomyces termitum]